MKNKHCQKLLLIFSQYSYLHQEYLVQKKMDCMRLLTHIHHILNLWVDDERPSLYDICRLWRMIQDHVLPGPITGIPLAFTNPKQSLFATSSAFPDMTPLLLCLKEQCTLIIILLYLINLFFFWLKKEKKKNKAGTVSHMQIEEKTPRSVILERQSRMTLTFHFAEMPVDYSVNWRMRETDRRREEKTKMELFWEGNIHLYSRWYAKYMFNGIYWFEVVATAERKIQYAMTIIIIYLNEYYNSGSSSNTFHICVNTVCVYLLEGCGEAWRRLLWALWLSHYPLCLLSLHCLSPLTCPVACRLQTGAG